MEDDEGQRRSGVAAQRRKGAATALGGAGGGGDARVQRIGGDRVTHLQYADDGGEQQLHLRGLVPHLVRYEVVILLTHLQYE